MLRLDGIWLVMGHIHKAISVKFVRFSSLNYLEIFKTKSVFSKKMSLEVDITLKIILFLCVIPSRINLKVTNILRICNKAFCQIA